MSSPLVGIVSPLQVVACADGRVRILGELRILGKPSHPVITTARNVSFARAAVIASEVE